MFRPNQTGILEIERNIHVVRKSYLVALRKILDKFKIHYILDRVSFHSTLGSLALAKAIHNTPLWKLEKDGGVSLDNQFGHSAKFRYNHLVIPSLDLFKLRLENTDSLTTHERSVLRSLRDNYIGAEMFSSSF